MPATPHRSPRRAPHPALHGLVGSYQGYAYDGLPPGRHHGLPSTALTVVIAFDEPLDVGWLHQPDSRSLHWSVASGLHRDPAVITHPGRQAGIQFDLSPAGSRALLGQPSAELSDALVPLPELVGGAGTALYDEVASATSWEARFAALDSRLLALLRRRQAESVARPEVAWSWSRLVSSPAPRVGDLAAEVGWSPRHLTAQFRNEYGLTPKQVARIGRFERARARLLRRQRPRLADLAADCGYADQAHFSREWQHLAGYTPTEWLRVEHPFLHDVDLGQPQ